MTESKSSEGAKRPPAVVRALVFTLKAVLPILVLVGAYLIYQGMMATAPEATRKTPTRQARLVEVVQAEPFREAVIVEARGVVMPAHDVTLTPQVSGEIVEISKDLTPGGRFRAGDVLLRIDGRDYDFAVQQRESEVTRARAALTLEEGNQDVALREYELLGQELTEADQALVFRKPQLDTAKGDLAAAEAMLRDARLDQERTVVKAPFDALVVSENVDLGTRLTAQTSIARIVGTETFWIELSVPQSDLRWIVLPNAETPGSRVTLRHPKVWGPDATREGEIIRLLPDLSDEGRMARLLVAVDDPMALKPEHDGKPRMLIGQYLEAAISGKEVDGAVRVAREHLREGDHVWVMNDEGLLEVRSLAVLYRDREAVLAQSGVAPGERIVITDLATGTAGMPLRTADEAAVDLDVEAKAEGRDT